MLRPNLRCMKIESIASALSRSRLAREVPDFEQSATKAQVDRLEKQLEGITRLKAAAAAPKMVQFSLGAWVKELVAEEAAGGSGFRLVSLVRPKRTSSSRSGPEACSTSGLSAMV